MRTIGMLIGIPDEDQAALRDRIDEGMRLVEGAPPEQAIDMSTVGASLLSTSSGEPTIRPMTS